MPKKCSTCKELKSESDFHKDKGRKDGLNTRCKICIGKENRRLKKIWRATHQEQNRQVASQWAKDNPIKHSIKNQRRRAMIKESNGTYTQAEWLELCARYDNRCLCCGEEKPLTADHVIPLSKGGSNDISNIQPLCGPCNSRKRQKTIDYRQHITT